MVDNIATTKISVPSYSIASDNINSDGVANPGENIRYIVTLQNNSSFVFTGLSLSGIPGDIGKSVYVASLVNSYSFTYNADDPSTYLSFTIPSTYQDSVFKVALLIADTSYNHWIDTLAFPVKPIGKIYCSPLTQLSGDSVGSFVISVVDSTHLKNHIYVITGVDSVAPGVSGYTLKDSTAGTILYANHALPDALGHTSPVVDGFKILLGTIDTAYGMKAYSVPSGTRQWTWSGQTDFFGFPNDATGFYGQMGDGYYWPYSNNSVPFSHLKNVLLKLAQTDTSGNILDNTYSSYGYRYLRKASAAAAQPSFAAYILNTTGIYPYQDMRRVPFSAWNVEDTLHPQQLAVGFFENNIPTGFVDGKYWPPYFTTDNNNSSTGAREWFFIFDSPYTGNTPSSSLAVDLYANTLPIMWIGTPARKYNTGWSNGDQFEIIRHTPPSSKNRWVFNTSVLTTSIQKQTIPTGYALAQNYPNPFNPTTTINFTLPSRSNVSLKIFDVLGREIATVVNGVMAAGTYTKMWDASRFASGIYFYRLQAGSYTQTKKLVLLK
ncbi:MAG TPA: T9SS type A sorting domain-containing protein [Bacteroidota bacterium]|nr:T9SS type A sorting domain-containing protein [Bacteroidota bacterium]